MQGLAVFAQFPQQLVQRHEERVLLLKNCAEPVGAIVYGFVTYQLVLLIAGVKKRPQT